MRKQTTNTMHKDLTKKYNDEEFPIDGDADDNKDRLRKGTRRARDTPPRTEEEEEGSHSTTIMMHWIDTPSSGLHTYLSTYLPTYLPHPANVTLHVCRAM